MIDLKQLNEIRGQLIAVTEGISEEQLNKKMNEQTWSIAQVLIHVAEAELRFIKLAKEAVESREIGLTSSIDLTPLADYNVKMTAPIEPPTDFFSKKAVRTSLQEGRDFTIECLTKWEDIDLDSIGMNHKRFGLMPVSQVTELIYNHDVNHLAQLKNLLQMLR
jgi:uncharacterized damage-inducible protein DinB